jgi:hypothetical protein
VTIWISQMKTLEPGANYAYAAPASTVAIHSIGFCLFTQAVLFSAGDPGFLQDLFRSIPYPTEEGRGECEMNSESCLISANSPVLYRLLDWQKKAEAQTGGQWNIGCQLQHESLIWVSALQRRQRGLAIQHTDYYQITDNSCSPLKCIYYTLIIKYPDTLCWYTVLLNRDLIAGNRFSCKLRWPPTQ